MKSETKQASVVGVAKMTAIDMGRAQLVPDPRVPHGSALMRTLLLIALLAIVLVTAVGCTSPVSTTAPISPTAAAATPPATSAAPTVAATIAAMAPEIPTYRITYGAS